MHDIAIFSTIGLKKNTLLMVCSSDKRKIYYMQQREAWKSDKRGSLC
jgi:hypothetical protein